MNIDLKSSKKAWRSEYILASFLIAIILILLLYKLVQWRIELAANTSSTSFVVDPNQQEVFVNLNKAIRLDKVPVEEILEARKVEVLKHNNLLDGEYTPTKSVFSGINHDGYWMSFARLFYYGKKPVKKSEVFNQSQASIQILNPFMLVKADFWGLSIWGSKNLKWNKKQYPIEQLSILNIPLAPEEQSLKYNPAHGVAELDYDLTGFVEKINPMLEKPLDLNGVDFSLSMQNARDLGFRYSYLDTESSTNIKNLTAVQTALDMPDRFDYMPVSWTNRLKLNHTSPSQPGYNMLQATTLPATAVIKLWYEKPKDIKDPANYIFNIHIR